MPAYRKKPVVVSAVQYLGRNKFSTTEPWLEKAIADGVVFARGKQMVVRTPEGEMLALPGTYIIQGVAGEIYPCAEIIFKTTYEPA